MEMFRSGTATKHYNLSESIDSDEFRPDGEGCSKAKGMRRVAAVIDPASSNSKSLC